MSPDPAGRARQDVEPLLNSRFRVEIDGLPRTGATEVRFPEARIVEESSQGRVVQYTSLTLKRGMTASSDWYAWWALARRSSREGRKRVTIVVMDQRRQDVHRWTFAEAIPSTYTVSPLSAAGSEPLIETLELTVGDFAATFADDPTR